MDEFDSSSTNSEEQQKHASSGEQVSGQRAAQWRVRCLRADAAAAHARRAAPRRRQPPAARADAFACNVQLVLSRRLCRLFPALRRGLPAADAGRRRADGRQREDGSLCAGALAAAAVAAAAAAASGLHRARPTRRPNPHCRAPGAAELGGGAGAAPQRRAAPVAGRPAARAARRERRSAARAPPPPPLCCAARRSPQVSSVAAVR